MTIDYLANHVACIPDLAREHYEHWRVIFERRGVSYEQSVNTFYERAQTQSLPLAVVAVRGGQVVGTASIKIQDLDPCPELTPWLGGVFVLPRFRGQGIATLLVERIIAEARRLGLPHLYLWTTSSESLYARLGWVPVEQMEYCGETIKLMRRKM